MRARTGTVRGNTEAARAGIRKQIEKLEEKMPVEEPKRQKTALRFQSTSPSGFLK